MVHAFAFDEGSGKNEAELLGWLAGGVSLGIDAAGDVMELRFGDAGGKEGLGGLAGGNEDDVGKVILGHHAGALDGEVAIPVFPAAFGQAGIAFALGLAAFGGALVAMPGGDVHHAGDAFDPGLDEAAETVA